jgi:hypothetical protein
MKADPARNEEDAPPEDGRLNAAFPLFMRKDFEVPVNNTAFEVGVDHDYPATLREMISAATVTYYLQNKSIDNVRRTYLKDMNYEEDPGGHSRLDRSFRKACERQVERIGEMLRTYPEILDRAPTVGEWIGDLTLIRASYSFERAFAEADKGALFEAVAIARMILEQLAWVYVIRNFDDVDKVRKTQTTKCIGSLSKKFSDVGKLYGWMSNHVHWDYEAHIKVVTNDGTFDGALSATSEFKAIAYAMLIALAYLLLNVFNSLMSEYSELAAAGLPSTGLIKESDFDPIVMISSIYDLSDRSLDILTIMNIVKTAA